MNVVIKHVDVQVNGSVSVEGRRKQRARYLSWLPCLLTCHFWGSQFPLL